MTSFTQRIENLPPAARRAVRIGMPIGIVAVGALIAWSLVATKTSALVGEPTVEPTPVEVAQVSRGDYPVVIHATGTVTAARSIRLEAQVSGRVEWINDNLRPGGRFRRGETMGRVDDSDYQVVVQQRQAALLRAQVGLDLERGRKEIAEREWQLLDGVRSDERGRSLALREPQLREAEAQLLAAQAALSQAELNVRRTRLTAPFDLVIEDESVDVGQIVRPGAPLATLLGTKEVWVVTPVPVTDLPWLSVPGAEATVTFDAGRGRREAFRGTAIEVLGSVERGGMMARILVAIQDPLGGEGDESAPLLVGSIVDVTLHGRDARGVYELARTAIRSGDVVWTVSAEGALDIRPVTIVHRTPTAALVKSELGDTSRIVTSLLATPVPGMPLETRNAATPVEQSTDVGGDR